MYDSDNEKSVAEQLEEIPEVKLFIKLPDWFVVKTPIGDYNPDWAVLISNDDQERLYFIFETKGNIGNNRPSEEFKMKCGEKHFEALKTGVLYIPTTSKLLRESMYFDENK